MTTATSDHGSTVRDNTARFIDSVAREYDSVAKELLSQYEREERLLGSITKREEKISAITKALSAEKTKRKAAEEKLAAAEKRLADAEERLHRLEQTKGLQLQRAYWRATRSIRRPNAR